MVSGMAVQMVVKTVEKMVVQWERQKVVLRVV
jgi:hypothetical protein